LGGRSLSKSQPLRIKIRLILLSVIRVGLKARRAMNLRIQSNFQNSLLLRSNYHMILHLAQTAEISAFPHLHMRFLLETRVILRVYVYLSPCDDTT